MRIAEADRRLSLLILHMKVPILDVSRALWPVCPTDRVVHPPGFTAFMVGSDKCRFD